MYANKRNKLHVRPPSHNCGDRRKRENVVDGFWSFQAPTRLDLWMEFRGKPPLMIKKYFRFFFLSSSPLWRIRARAWCRISLPFVNEIQILFESTSFNFGWWGDVFYFSENSNNVELKLDYEQPNNRQIRSIRESSSTSNLLRKHPIPWTTIKCPVTRHESFSFLNSDPIESCSVSSTKHKMRDLLISSLLLVRHQQEFENDVATYSQAERERSSRTTCLRSRNSLLVCTKLPQAAALRLLEIIFQFAISFSSSSTQELITLRSLQIVAEYENECRRATACREMQKTNQPVRMATGETTCAWKKYINLTSIVSVGLSFCILCTSRMSFLHLLIHENRFHAARLASLHLPSFGRLWCFAARERRDDCNFHLRALHAVFVQLRTFLSDEFVCGENQICKTSSDLTCKSRALHTREWNSTSSICSSLDLFIALENVRKSSSSLETESSLKDLKMNANDLHYLGKNISCSQTDNVPHCRLDWWLKRRKKFFELARQRESLTSQWAEEMSHDDVRRDRQLKLRLSSLRDSELWFRAAE